VSCGRSGSTARRGRGDGGEGRRCPWRRCRVRARGGSMYSDRRGAARTSRGPGAAERRVPSGARARRGSCEYSIARAAAAAAAGAALRVGGFPKAKALVGSPNWRVFRRRRCAVDDARSTPSTVGSAARTTTGAVRHTDRVRLGPGRRLRRRRRTTFLEVLDRAQIKPRAASGAPRITLLVLRHRAAEEYAINGAGAVRLRAEGRYGRTSSGRFASESDDSGGVEIEAQVVGAARERFVGLTYDEPARGQQDVHQHQARELRGWSLRREGRKAGVAHCTPTAGRPSRS
jgi:hypothetical protein